MDSDGCSKMILSEYSINHNYKFCFYQILINNSLLSCVEKPSDTSFHTITQQIIIKYLKIIWINNKDLSFSKMLNINVINEEQTFVK